MIILMMMMMIMIMMVIIRKIYKYSPLQIQRAYVDPITGLIMNFSIEQADDSLILDP